MGKCFSFWVKTSEKRDFFARFYLLFPKTTRDASHFIYYGCYGLRLEVAVSVKTWFEGKSFFKRFFVWFNVYCKYDSKLNYLCLAKCVWSKFCFQLSHETWFHCHFFYFIILYFLVFHLFMYFWPLIWFNLVRRFFYHFLLSVFFNFFYCFVFWFTLFYFLFYFFIFFHFFFVILYLYFIHSSVWYLCQFSTAINIIKKQNKKHRFLTENNNYKLLKSL